VLDNLPLEPAPDHQRLSGFAEPEPPPYETAAAPRTHQAALSEIIGLLSRSRQWLTI